MIRSRVLGPVAVHSMLIVTAAALLCGVMVYPFLPGEYDPMAVPLSQMAQVLGAAGLPLLPLGIAWLAHEVLRRSRARRSLPPPRGTYGLAVAALILASIAIVPVVLAGGVLGVGVLVLWALGLKRWAGRARALRSGGANQINPAPLYLVALPLAAFLMQTLAATPATTFSRDRAIANSAVLIRQIEAYRARAGEYPPSLSAVHTDFSPSVVGVEAYRYDRDGTAYNLFFEQPRFLFDELGAREFLVYNVLDGHLLPAHDADILDWSPEQLRNRQGWYSARETGTPHWRSLLFD